MKILISGEGGQGVQIIAELIARAAHQKNLFTSYMPNFGVEQRGGASVAFLQVSEKNIIYPKFGKADLVVAMSNRAIGAVEKYLDNNTILIFDSSNIDHSVLKTLEGKAMKFLNVGAREYANENYTTKVTNMIFLGVILYYENKIDIETINSLLSEKLKDSDKKDLLEMDLKAIQWGYNYPKSNITPVLEGKEEKKTENIYSDEEKSWQRFPEQCKGCGLCIIKCPQKAIQFSEDLNFMGTQMPVVDIKKCISCGICQANCPDGAIEVKKK